VTACLEDQQVAALAEGSGTAGERASWRAHAETCQRCRAVVAAAIRGDRDSGVAATQLAHGSGGGPAALGHAVTELARGSAQAANEDLVQGGAPTEPARPVAMREQLGAGDVIGRYRITRVLGAGGMGVVYEARDPELDRLLAIKLLRDRARTAETDLTARLVREAKALAALAHPNVVAIHDVGEHAGCPFLAMEYIRGTTLRDWLHEQPRTWRVSAAVFEQIARGLAAAHAAGLVHRDVKPDNVMVGIDGRARVTDFGLVRPTRSDDQPRASGTDDPVHLTQTGAVMGTPAYMSAEQHLGEPGDARTDQFSFCVALYEAVYGKRPFAGNSWAELAAAVIDGRAEPPPSGVRAPRWLRRLIDRGLARAPAERHPDMATIADQLAAGLARRRSLVFAAIAGTTIVAAVAAFALLHQAGPGCDGASDQLATFWNTGRRAQMWGGFLASGKPFAADAFGTASETLDRNADRWSAAHRATCEATEVRHEQSPELLDQRMACLATRREEMRELVELFVHSDVDTIEHAARAAQRLTSAEECVNAPSLDARVRAPVLLRPRIDELEAALARARGMSDTGKFREALEVARPIARAATALAYRPLEADAAWQIADIEDNLGDYAEAERLYREVIHKAEAGGDDRLKAMAWTSLLDVIGSRRAKPADALALESQARAVIERVDDARLRAQLDEAIARALERSGSYPASLQHHDAAIAGYEKLGNDAGLANALEGRSVVLSATGDFKAALVDAQRILDIRRRQLGGAHPATGKAIENLAIAQYDVGDSKAAVATMREALGVLVAAYGTEHVEVAQVRNNLGAILERVGRYDEATTEIEAALALRKKLLGPDHPDVATSLVAVGNVYFARKDWKRAIRAYRDCLELREKLLGPDHPEVELAAGNLGAALGNVGDFDGAEKMYRRALDIAVKTRGPDSPGANIERTNLARLALDRGNATEAVSLFQQALASDEKRLGKDHPQLAYHLQGLGGAYLKLKRPAEAIPVLERALALWDRAPTDPNRVADTRMTLAEAISDSGGDRNRARDQAAAALAIYQQSPQENAESIQYVKTWQRKHP
jgi:tetratricopeptide (TPR) repeat protein/tRNA A-37 threonylcarbamoyl transferase component Bud32